MLEKSDVHKARRDNRSGGKYLVYLNYEYMERNRIMDKLIFYTLNILIRAFGILVQLLPYLVAGILAGEGLRYVSLHKIVGRLRFRNTFVTTSAAAALGMVSPLCTYGTVPVVMQLNRSGVPAPVLIVFLIASSMMNPQLFVMTWGGIGSGIALLRLATIMLFAVLMGVALSLLPEKWILSRSCMEELNRERCEADGAPRAFTWRSYIVNILKSLERMGFYVVIGALLAAAIEVAIPGDLVNSLYKQSKALQIMLMSVLSIPFYSCGGGVIPIVSALMSGGMSTGAALAFLNVGSATRVTVLSALAAIVRPLFIFIYIGALMLFSILIGYLF